MTIGARGRVQGNGAGAEEDAGMIMGARGDPSRTTGSVIIYSSPQRSS